MSEVTCILSAIEQGDPHAAAQLLPLVYEELRKLAAQKLERSARRCSEGQVRPVTEGQPLSRQAATSSCSAL